MEGSRLPHLIQRMRVARVEGQGVVVLLYTFYPLFSLSPLSYIQIYRCMSMMYGGIWPLSERHLLYKWSCFSALETKALLHQAHLLSLCVGNVHDLQALQTIHAQHTEPHRETHSHKTRYLSEATSDHTYVIVPKKIDRQGKYSKGMKGKRHQSRQDETRDTNK